VLVIEKSGLKKGFLGWLTHSKKFSSQHMRRPKINWERKKQKNKKRRGGGATINLV